MHSMTTHDQIRGADQLQRLAGPEGARASEELMSSSTTPLLIVKSLPSTSICTHSNMRICIIVKLAGMCLYLAAQLACRLP